MNIPCRQYSRTQSGDIRKSKRSSEKKKRCEGVKRNLREFQSNWNKVCALPYIRSAKYVKQSGSHTLPQFFVGGKKVEKSLLLCPRALTEEEKRAWYPICKKLIVQVPEVKEPFDTSVCVFCLQSLYYKGYLHDLHEKIRIIKKQSEILGDDIAWRIGTRTSICVHKKCYVEYLDSFEKMTQKEEAKKDKEFEEDEEFEDLAAMCAGIKKESKDEIIPDPPPIKPNFCLNKYKPPAVNPRKYTLKN